MRSHEGKRKGKERSVYSEVQCSMGDDHMVCPVDRQTHANENITFPQLYWWAVINQYE